MLLLEYCNPGKHTTHPCMDAWTCVYRYTVCSTCSQGYCNTRGHWVHWVLGMRVPIIEYIDTPVHACSMPSEHSSIAIHVHSRRYSILSIICTWHVCACTWTYHNKTRETKPAVPYSSTHEYTDVHMQLCHSPPRSFSSLHFHFLSFQSFFSDS